jgi:hypothetical protein
MFCFTTLLGLLIEARRVGGVALNQILIALLDLLRLLVRRRRLNFATRFRRRDVRFPASLSSIAYLWDLGPGGAGCLSI